MDRGRARDGAWAQGWARAWGRADFGLRLGIEIGMVLRLGLWGTWACTVQVERDV